MGTIPIYRAVPSIVTSDSNLPASYDAEALDSVEKDASTKDEKNRSIHGYRLSERSRLLPTVKPANNEDGTAFGACI